MLYLIKKRYFILLNLFIFSLMALFNTHVTVNLQELVKASQIKNVYYNKAMNIYNIIKVINTLNIYIIAKYNF